MTHDPTRRTQRQRAPKSARHTGKAECKAIVATHNREGLDGVNDIVDAIGGGCIEQWQEEDGDE